MLFALVAWCVRVSAWLLVALVLLLATACAFPPLPTLGFALPGLPGLPALPALPSLPGLPGLPPLPTLGFALPGLPGLPALPALPTLGCPLD